MRTRIICIGNSLFSPDSAGPKVYGQLTDMNLPANTELIDGGLGGLNLLPFLEHTDLVIFIDAVSGFLDSNGVIVIENPAKFLQQTEEYGHDAGLSYLLQVAPAVIDTPIPKVLLIGIEGIADSQLCREAAHRCLQYIRANNTITT
jgi:hydrogenase maturation protease